MNAFGAVCAAALLGVGCAGPITTGLRFGPAASEFHDAAAGRDVRTVVLGNPFGASQRATEKATLDAMQGAYFGPAAHFTPRPGASARQRYHVVMLFNPPPLTAGDDICGDAAMPVATAAGETLRLLGAFCRDGRALSEVQGRIAAVKDLDDPGFRALIRQVTTELVSPSPQRENRRAGDF